MKRVLVTGGTGFIGRHSLPMLARKGYDVHALTSRAVVPTTTDVTWHRANLFDHTATEDIVARIRPSHLLHFAWYAEHGRFWNSPLNLQWVGASLELIQAFQRHGG